MNKHVRLFVSAILGIASSGLTAAAAGNANLISVEFVACDTPFAGLDIPVSGDTSPLATAPAKNTDGLVFTGQTGPWNAFNVDPDCKGNFTYRGGTAPSGFLTNGGGTATTVKFALTSTYRCNIENHRLTGSLRRVSADCNVSQSTANPVTWYISGLVPNGFYQLICFSSSGGTYVANGAAPERDSEGDANWSCLQADSTGTISGSMTATTEAVSMYGFQLCKLTSVPLTRTLAGQVVMLGLPVGLVLFWALWLRRQLKQKSQELATEMRARRDAAVEFQATLRERKRLAANLHDTLLQTISGLSYQIEACEAESLPKAERKADHLETARRMVRRAQDDLRGTVWALRTLPLQERSFPEALQVLADQLADGRGVKITVETETELPRLSEFVAGSLLLVAQEAIYNALKHAQPSRIEVQVAAAQDGEHITLVVRDDGAGFDSPARPRSQPGHFGLDGMRERMEQLGGELRIESQPGRGTSVHAKVPRSALDNEPG